MTWDLVTGLDDTHDFDHILFKDKGYKIILRLNVLERQPMPQPDPHSEIQPESRPELQNPLPSPEPYPESQLKPSQTRSNSLPAIVHDAAEDTKKIKSIRDRLGSSVTYLEHFLSFAGIVEDVSRFIQNQTSSRYLRLLDPSCNQSFNWITVYYNKGT